MREPIGYTLPRTVNKGEILAPVVRPLRGGRVRGGTLKGTWFPMHIMYPPDIRPVSTMESTMDEISSARFRIRTRLSPSPARKQFSCRLAMAL